MDPADCKGKSQSTCLIETVERFKARTGYSPERVLADQNYRTRENRNYCKAHGIRISGPKLGRPGVNTKTDKKQEYQDNSDRIEVECTFSLGKRCYGRGCIVTKQEETQLTSIALSVFVTNLFKIHKRILYALLYLFQYGKDTNVGVCRYLLNQQTLFRWFQSRKVSDMNKEKEFLDFLLERFKIERERFDRSGVYAHTQRLLAYNSNKIEGSTLTEEQTASLFDNGTLPKSDDYYRVKDVEEMNGHFLMFNKMLDTLDESLSQELIKQFHYELKSGVFEDRANGYAIGDYKQRPNMIGMYQTVRPEHVAQEMYLLVDWYNNQKVDISVLAEFHARYEIVHPFQDGNGRTGRLILFRECLKNNIMPVVIEDANRNEYLEALKEYREEKILNKLASLFEKEQQFYFEKCKYFK